MRIWTGELVNGFGGIRITSEGNLRINPRLPEKWKNLKFKINWRGKEYGIEIAKDRITLKP